MIGRPAIVILDALAGFAFAGVWFNTKPIGKLILTGLISLAVVGWWFLFVRPVRDDFQYAEGTFHQITDSLPIISTSATVVPAGGPYFVTVRVRPLTRGTFNRGIYGTR